MRLSRSNFEKLALEQTDLLYRVARRMVRDPSLAEDLVQETFLRAFRGQDNFSLENYGIRPWLLRIMHNLNVSRGQREQKAPELVEDQALEAAAISLDQIPIDPANREAMDEKVVHALDDLHPDYRTVLLLWAVEGFSYKEIADALDIPIGTVMSRLYRARGRMVKELEDYARTEGLIRE